jgi:hypothetical protein
MENNVIVEASPLSSPRVVNGETSSAIPKSGDMLEILESETIAAAAFKRIIKIAGSIMKGKKSIAGQRKLLIAQITSIFTIFVYHGYSALDVKVFVFSILIVKLEITSPDMRQYILDTISSSIEEASDVGTAVNVSSELVADTSSTEDINLLTVSSNDVCGSSSSQFSGAVVSIVVPTELSQLESPSAVTVSTLVEVVNSPAQGIVSKTLSPVHVKRRDAQIAGKRVFTSPRIYADAQPNNVVVSSTGVDDSCKTESNPAIVDLLRESCHSTGTGVKGSVAKSTLSPNAAVFVPRAITTPSVSFTFGEVWKEESSYVTPPSSPPWFTKSLAYVSPSRAKEATKDAQWEAWRKKRKKNQYTPPLVNPSCQTMLSKNKVVPASSFVCHVSPELPTSLRVDNLVNLSNLTQEIVSPLIELRRPRQRALRARTFMYKRSYCGKFWYILIEPLFHFFQQKSSNSCPQLSTLFTLQLPHAVEWGNRTASSALLTALHSPVRGHDPGPLSGTYLALIVNLLVVFVFAVLAHDRFTELV